MPTESEQDPLTPQGAELARLRDQARWPIGLKLDWLDDAQQLVTELERKPRPT